jgi:hypothetical protein
LLCLRALQISQSVTTRAGVIARAQVLAAFLKSGRDPEILNSTKGWDPLWRQRCAPRSVAQRLAQRKITIVIQPLNIIAADAPAELFLSKQAKNSRIKYRRFATAAEAIRYAVEDLRTPRALGAWMQVGDEPVWSKDMWLPKVTRRYEV